MFTLSDNLLSKIKKLITSNELVLEGADKINYFCLLCSGGVADGCSASCNNGCDGCCSAVCRNDCEVSCDSNCSQGCYGNN